MDPLAPQPMRTSVLDHDRGAAAIAVLFGLAVVLPFALGVSLPGRADLGFHATLIESQFDAWRTLGRPSPVLAALGGEDRFGLLPAAYGGTAYGLAGLLRFAMSIEVAVGVVAAAGYTGLSWGVYRCARSARLGTRPSLLLAVTVVCGGQVISALYARMALAEVLAVGSVAALAGATATLWTRGPDRPGCVPIALLSAAVFVGGHPLTLVWAGVSGAAAATVVLVGMRPSLQLGRRWPAVVPAALGAAATIWQWPLALAVVTTTRSPDAREYITSGYFFEPFGAGSGPVPLHLLDPFRRSAGGGQLAPYRVALPVLLIGTVIWVLASTRHVRDLSRRWWTSTALLVLAGAVALLPTSRRVVELLWPVASMQYHWRIYTYAVALVVIAALVLLPGLGGVMTRRLTVVLTVVACVELVLGAVQVTRSYPELPDPVRLGDVEELVTLDPNAVLRNDVTLTRSEDLPLLEDPVPVASTAGTTPIDPEAPLRATRPAAADRFAVPSVAAPPFVDLPPGWRAVGWAPSLPAAGSKDDTARQYWLVVEGPTQSGTVVVDLSQEGSMGFARRSVGPATWVLVAAVLVTVLWAGVVTARRHRTRRPGWGSSGAVDATRA